MKNNLSIQLSAFCLLALFSVTTVIGFACSIGVDMGFNSTHHKQNAQKRFGPELSPEQIVHLHKHGKSHVYSANQQPHNHNESPETQVSKSAGQETSNEDCCAGKVNGFREVEKSMPKAMKIDHPLFYVLLSAAVSNVDLLTHTDFVKDIRRFVRNYHPPISDIRIAIQSFQI